MNVINNSMIISLSALVEWMIVPPDNNILLIHWVVWSWLVHLPIIINLYHLPLYFLIFWAFYIEEPRPIGANL